MNKPNEQADADSHPTKNDDAGTANSDARNPSRAKLKNALKWIVAVIVILGLVVTIQSAVSSWNQQRDSLLVRMGELDRQIELETNPTVRTQLRSERDQTEKQLPSWSNVRWGRLILGGVVYFFGLLPSAWVLQMNCDRFGKSPKLSTATLAQLFGHLGKYVPGKAMVILMRAAILRRDGVGSLTATVSIFVETFMIMAVGASIAGAVILPLDVPAWIKWTALAMAIGALLPTLPPIVRRVIEKFESRMKTRSELRIDWGWFFRTWSLCVLSWILLGGSFALIVSGIPGTLQPVSDSLSMPVQLYALSTASIGLAMVIGFASLLPGGAGIRELVLVTVMGLMVNPTHGLLAAIATRLVSLGVEIAAASACWLWISTDPEKQPPKNQRNKHKDAKK